jgi:hypothetical protein
VSGIQFKPALFDHDKTKGYYYTARRRHTKKEEAIVVDDYFMVRQNWSGSAAFGVVLDAVV